MFRQVRLPLFLNVQTGLEAHQFSYKMATGFLARGQRGQGVMLTTHLHLVSRLRMRVAVPSLRLQAFIAQAATTILLYEACPESKDTKVLNM